MFRGLTRSEHFVALALVAALTAAATISWYRSRLDKQPVVAHGLVERGGTPGESGHGGGDAKPSPPAVESLPAEMHWDGLLNINMADSAALQTLPGVDANVAEKVLRHRRALGPFHSPDELRRIQGLDPQLADSLVPLVATPLRSERLARLELESRGLSAGDDTIVDLNAATYEQLLALDGVGPERAKAILRLRSERGGRFLKVEEILRAEGVGPATLEKNRHRLAVR